jgi:hypothetical protein
MSFKIFKKFFKKIIQIPIAIQTIFNKEKTLLFRKKKYLVLSILLPLFLAFIYSLMLLSNNSEISIFCL